MFGESSFHIASAIFVFAAAFVPIYLSFRLRDRFRKLLIALGIFILFHGVYHVFGSLGYDFIASSILEPISAAALVAFGIMYLAEVRAASRRGQKEELSA